MLRTHPFNMTFEEIRKMRFSQMLIMIDELKKSNEEKAKVVSANLKRTKEVMPVYDISTGIYGQ